MPPQWPDLQDLQDLQDTHCQSGVWMHLHMQGFFSVLISTSKYVAKKIMLNNKMFFEEFFEELKI